MEHIVLHKRQLHYIITNMLQYFSETTDDLLTEVLWLTNIFMFICCIQINTQFTKTCWHAYIFIYTNMSIYINTHTHTYVQYTNEETYAHTYICIAYRHIHVCMHTRITRQMLAALWGKPEAYHHAVVIQHCDYRSCNMTAVLCMVCSK